MKLRKHLKRLFRKKKTAGHAAAQSDTPDLAQYTGMRAEVTSPDGRLLFVAKLLAVQGNTAELHQYLEAAAPEDSGPIQVRIRGYSDLEKKAVYLEGSITPRPQSIWQVTDLALCRVGNDRAFFRLDIDIAASIIVLGRSDAAVSPCRVTNISIGGACVRTACPCRKDEKFLLQVTLLKERAPSVLLCQILRTTPCADAMFEYGCRFLALSEAEAEQITQKIFAVQRQKRW